MIVVYVDDDVDDLDLFREAINVVDHAITLHTLQSCKAVEDFLRQPGHDPSFVFIDVNMPKMDGYQCARIVRSMSPATIVLISTFFNPERRRAFSLPNLQYMDKSSDFIGNVEAIRKIFSRKDPIF